MPSVLPHTASQTASEQVAQKAKDDHKKKPLRAEAQKGLLFLMRAAPLSVVFSQ